MSRIQEFMEWLDEQSYWVEHEKFKEEWSDIPMAESTGITMKKEDGNWLVPRRDLKNLARRGARFAGDKSSD